MRTKEVLAAVVALCVIPLSANADTKDQRVFEIGAFGGYHLFNNNNELGVPDVNTAESLNHGFVLGLRAALPVFSVFDLETEVSITPTSTETTDTNVLTVGWRLHALAHLTGGKIRPFVLLGAGTTTAISDDDAIVDSETDALFHVGGGIKMALGDSWGLRVDARLLLPPSKTNDSVTTDGEFLFGLYKSFGGAAKMTPMDRDNDGVIDSEDACPDEPEDLDGQDDSDGCPEADNDTDGDGIADKTDSCPDQPEDKDGFEDEDGCPETDNDSDDIADADDKCPNEPEDKDGFEDEDGCPETDNDGDGIADELDQCPAEAETTNGFEDEDGCPDTLPVAVKKFSGNIEGIRFELGSSTIRPVSYALLNKAAKVFKEYPDLKLEVQGHTDSTGTVEHNTELSQARADTVMGYLVNQGISPDRLKAVGYGPANPIADNATRAGQAQNRRVEFKLMSEL